MRLLASWCMPSTGWSTWHAWAAAARRQGSRRQRCDWRLDVDMLQQARWSLKACSTGNPSLPGFSPVDWLPLSLKAACKACRQDSGGRRRRTSRCLWRANITPFSSSLETWSLYTPTFLNRTVAAQASGLGSVCSATTPGTVRLLATLCRRLRGLQSFQALQRACQDTRSAGVFSLPLLDPPLRAAAFSLLLLREERKRAVAGESADENGEAAAAAAGCAGLERQTPGLFIT